MSLQVWLPLNGNTNNYGVCNFTPTVVTAPTYVTGKLGKAMSTGAITIPAAAAASFYNNKAMSFCFWIYALSSSSTGAIIGQTSMAAGDNRMYTIFQYASPNHLHLSWQGNEQNNATFLSGQWTNVFPTNTWTHCAVTYDGSTARIYINGTQTATATGTSPRTNFNYNVPIPNSSIRYLNDLRIYDECLSEKQVREISKGLIVHYPLSDEFVEGTTNIMTAKTVSAQASPGGGWGGHTAVWSVENLSNSPIPSTQCNKIVITYSGSGGGGVGRDIQTNISCTASSTYTYSCYVKTPDELSPLNNNILYRYEKNSSGTQVTEAGCWTDHTKCLYLGDNWYRLWGTFTVSSTTTNFRVCSFVYPSKSCTYYIACWQLELKDHVTPYVLGTRNETTLYDTSGFLHNASIVSAAPTVVLDSPKYLYSHKYIGSTGNAHICNTTDCNFTDNFSWSCWVKTNYTGTTAQYIWTVGRADSGGYGYGIQCASTSQCNIRFGNSSWALAVTGGTWTHIAFTKSGATCKIYKNGALASTQTFSGTLPTYSDGAGIGIGCFHYASGNIYPYYGNISDFRIYATALSDADILELYQTSASIDSKGNIVSYEFSE